MIVASLVKWPNHQNDIFYVGNGNDFLCFHCDLFVVLEETTFYYYWLCIYIDFDEGRFGSGWSSALYQRMRDDWHWYTLNVQFWQLKMKLPYDDAYTFICCTCPYHPYNQLNFILDTASFSTYLSSHLLSMPWFFNRCFFPSVFNYFLDVSVS